MIEQGFAQQRMWMRGDASVEVGSDATLLGEKIERDARLLVERMNEWVDFPNTSFPLPDCSIADHSPISQHCCHQH